MVLCSETDDGFAQTLSEVNEPKHIQDYCRGNGIVGSPSLASEANVRSQNESFPSQVLNSLSNEISKAYLRGSPDQEITRYKNYLQLPQSQNPSTLTVDNQNYSQALTPSTISIGTDVGKNSKENREPPVISREMKRYHGSHQVGITNSEQQQIQKKHIQVQENVNMLPLSNDLSLSAYSLHSSYQPSKDYQMNLQNQHYDSNMNINTISNFPVDFTNRISNNNQINVETCLSSGSSSISHEETSSSGITSRRTSQETNSSSRPTSRTCFRSSDSRDLNTTASNLISTVQPCCTDEISNPLNTVDQDARLQNIPTVANEPQSSRNLQMSRSKSPGKIDLHQDSFSNGLSIQGPQKDLQALMLLTGSSKSRTKRSITGSPDSKNGVRATRRSSKLQNVSEISGRTIPYQPMHSHNVNCSFVHQPYSHLPARYLQQALYPQQATGYPQHPTRYLQQALYPQHNFSQQSVHSIPPPLYPEQLGYSLQPFGYGQQLSGYIPLQRISEQTQLPRYAPRPQFSERAQYCEPVHQFPEYAQNHLENSRRFSSISQQRSNYPEEFFRYSQALMGYTQQARHPQLHPQCTNQFPGYNQLLSNQVQEPSLFEEQYPIQHQRIPAENRQCASQTQQFLNQTQEFPDQTPQLSGQTQQCLHHKQAPQLSRNYIDKAQFFPPNRLSSPLEHLTSSLQYPLANFPNQMNHHPETLKHFPSQNLSDLENQQNLQAFPEDLHKNPIPAKPFRSWHIPEIVSNLEKSESSKCVESSVIRQNDASEHLKVIPVVQTERNSTISVKSPNFQITPHLPSDDKTSASKPLPANLGTTSQNPNLENQGNEKQQSNTSPDKNVTEGTSKQFSNLFQVTIPSGVVLVTASLVDVSSSNSDQVAETSETYLEDREWLLKSPAPLEIDCPKIISKKDRKFRSSYKPHKGIKSTVRRYRARGISIRSPPLEIYQKEAAENRWEDTQDDEDDAEDENDHQDTVNKVARDEQNFHSPISEIVVNEENRQKEASISEISTSSREVNTNFSDSCEISEEKDLPTAYDIITGRWTFSEGFKKKEIHHQGLPNLQALLFKPDVYNVPVKKQKSR